MNETNETAIVTRDGPKVETSTQLVLPGQWYWVTSERDVYDEALGAHREETYEWLGCVMSLGSNFVELEEPGNGHSCTSERIHCDVFYDRCRFEPDHERIITETVQYWQSKAAQHLKEIAVITARLGVSSQPTIVHGTQSHTENASNRSLVLLTQAPDIKGYQQDLVQAKEVQLPELFKEVAEANKEVMRWMTASTLPLQAQVGGMKEVLRDINDRIFNVSLYAGLTEQVVRCCDGKSADFADKLHVMQRRLYMDEECLLNYSHGGMEFGDIEAFDAWISTPVNRDRILPYSRTIVAMQVRREEKERESDGRLLTAFINFKLAKADKLTFLFIRNGERVYRLSCDLDFGTSLIPDRSEFDPTEPMMVRLFAGSVKEMIRKDEYQARLDAYNDRNAKVEQWEKDNPKETWNEEVNGWRNNPYKDWHDFSQRDWQPFDSSSVYFDDAHAEIQEQVKQYNRIALIIQGLFDRSEVLQPHPPVRVWNPESFAASIQPVYDGSDVLNSGEPLDFEAYRAACNASLNADSVVIGQQDAFLIREAERENERSRKDWRRRETRSHTRYKPYGNPGPGYLAKMASWNPRKREATFRWSRERLTYNHYKTDSISCRIVVPESQLFNVSAYKKDDYLRFFADHRTRAQYLQWAPLLLTAEEYVAGNAVPQEPQFDQE